MDKSMRIAKLEAILIPLLDVIIGFSSLASLLYGGYLALIGQITLGRFVAFNQYVNMLVWPMLACPGRLLSCFPRELHPSAVYRKSWKHRQM